MKHLGPALLLAFATLRLSALELYVSPAGDDSNPGTIASPFASIGRARGEIRALKERTGLPEGGVTVWLVGGYYNLTGTLEFGSQDSGSASVPVIYAAMPGKAAFITGARTLDPAWFARVDSTSPVWARLDPAAQGKVYAVNLREHGIADFGSLKAGGFGRSTAAPLEIFCSGRPMTLARWPNAGQPLARTVAAQSSTEFTYSDPRPRRWAQAQDVWLHGLWKTTWADFHVNVLAVDPARRTITLSAPPEEFGMDANRPYYAYNLLEEIDEPGEYYVDRAEGVLYLWPPAPLVNTAIQVSMLEDSLLSLNGAQHLTFRDLVLEATRGPLVTISSGDHVVFERCLMRNAGQYAASVGGSNNGLDQCEIVDCGEDGVLLGGGVRASLTPGNNFVTNSRIHRIARINWTYHPGISLKGGCGNLVAHNLIDDLPHSAVIFSGNNHVIEYNEIRRVCQITNDASAIYSGRDWGYRGNKILGNFIHDVRSSENGFGVRGVFLDDCMSSAEISGNILYRIADAAINCGGGRDNIMTNNIIALCGIGHYNGDYSRKAISNAPHSSWNLLERLAAEGIRYQSEPWASAYPACAAIPNSWEMIQQGLWRNPQGCVFSGNAGWGNARWMVEDNSSHTGVFAVYASISNNSPDETALFDEDACNDRPLRPADLRASIPGFKPIPFASIGPLAKDGAAAAIAPLAPLLEASPAGAPESGILWSDDGDLPNARKAGFDLERRNSPDGPWVKARSLGPESDFATLAGLAPATAYLFRIRTYNGAGDARSNVLKLTTPAAPPAAGKAIQIDAKDSFVVVNDAHRNGRIGASSPSPGGRLCVKLFDAGDAIRIPFTLDARKCLIRVRVRSGDGSSPTVYWPKGYSFRLDDREVALRGDTATISTKESGYGPTYWGTMSSDSQDLKEGPHAVEITSARDWALVDYLQVVPLTVPVVRSFPDWQSAHFSSDQIADGRISAWSATPVGDRVVNLLKYALGLDPWAAAPGSFARLSRNGGTSTLSYSRPEGLTDLSYVVEASDDNTRWTPVAQASAGAAGGIETIDAAETDGSPRLIRLRVSLGPWEASTDALSVAGGDAGSQGP
jgi:hypothetical protein